MQTEAPSGSPGVWSRPARTIAHPGLIALLAFCSGSVDIVALMRMGGVFTSVVTGNLVFLGRAIGASAAGSAVHAGLAVVGYSTGVVLGSHLASRPTDVGHSRGWSGSVTTVLVLELALLTGLNTVWIIEGGAPRSSVTTLLLGAAALALGAQSAAARAISGSPPTTYMTGALTILLESIATLRIGQVNPSAIAGLIALIVGAAAGAALAVHAPRYALVPALLAVGTVIATKQWEHHRERGQLPLKDG